MKEKLTTCNKLPDLCYELETIPCMHKCLSKNASATDLWKAMNYLIVNSQQAKQVTLDSQKAKKILF